MELAKAPAHPDYNSNNFDSRPEQLGCFALLRHTGCNPHSFREVGLRIGYPNFGCEWEKVVGEGVHRPCCAVV